MKTPRITKAAARAETKAINARLGEIETAWTKRGMTDAEYDERHNLLRRRAELTAILLPGGSTVDSLIR